MESDAGGQRSHYQMQVIFTWFARHMFLIVQAVSILINLNSTTAVDKSEILTFYIGCELWQLALHWIALIKCNRWE